VTVASEIKRTRSREEHHASSDVSHVIRRHCLCCCCCCCCCFELLNISLLPHCLISLSPISLPSFQFYFSKFLLPSFSSAISPPHSPNLPYTSPPIRAASRLVHQIKSFLLVHRRPRQFSDSHSRYTIPRFTAHWIVIYGRPME